MLPIGPSARQVQCIRRPGKSDVLVLSAETEQWLRHGYETRMSTVAVRRDLGEILAHGERESGIGQGEVADQAAQPTPEPPAAEQASPATQRPRRGRDRRLRRPRTSGRMMNPQQLTAAPADTGGTAAPIPSAAQLAARIQIPRRLPPRYDGQPLQHLSHSSYNRFVLCPEDWRRRYMLGEKTAPSGSMFLGRQVDDAITLYYRRILEHGERLSVDQVKDAFWDGWKAAVEAEREQLGIAWEADLPEESAFKLGLDAVELSLRELIPRLGDPVAVQRKVEYVIAPGLEWGVLCYLDLETVRPDHGEQVAAVVDYKVKTTPLTQYKADHDFQPPVYLAGRWLEGDPAAEFAFYPGLRVIRGRGVAVRICLFSGGVAGLAPRIITVLPGMPGVCPRVGIGLVEFRSGRFCRSLPV